MSRAGAPDEAHHPHVYGQFAAVVYGRPRRTASSFCERTAMIDLSSASVPKGWKVPAAPEKAGLPGKVKTPGLSKRDQRLAWFRHVNPNGCVSAIMTRQNCGSPVVGSGAIPKSGAEKLRLAEPKARRRVLPLPMVFMEGIGPIMAKANIFHGRWRETIDPSSPGGAVAVGHRSGTSLGAPQRDTDPVRDSGRSHECRRPDGAPNAHIILQR
jgi:hypothetical protein